MFLGALALQLNMDKRNYLVGEAPVYTLMNAEPGSQVKWGSFKNGIATGENREFYDQVIGPLGGAELAGGNFAETDEGNWQKIAYVISPGGNESVAQAFFTVSKVAASTTPTPTPSTESWLGGDFEFDFGGNAVTVNRGAAVVVGAIALFFAFKPKGR